MKPIWISEIFGPVLQGEGALIGRPTVFVRTAGCDFRCRWCDSLYAVLPEYKAEWTPMTPNRVLDDVKNLTRNQPILITLSGGNPALQPLEELIAIGRAQGFTFCMETQGSVCKSWFAQLQHLVLSPKPPSSGMTTDWEILAQCVDSGAKNCSLKVVVFDQNDYEFARQVYRRFPETAFYLQAGSDVSSGGIEYSNATAQRLDEVMRWCLRDGWTSVSILPQLHVLLWGQKRGV